MEQTTMSGEAGDVTKPEQHSTFRLDALGVSATDGLVEGPPKRRVPMQLVVLASLVTVAGGALYAMRRLGMGPMGAIAEVSVVYEASKSGARDHEKLLADLNASHVEHQVPSEQVQKNPFRMPELRPGTPDQPVTKAPTRDLAAEKAAQELADRQARIDTLLSTLRVYTVLSGARGVARIGDETVRVGDTLADLFVVTAIEGREVLVTVDQVTYTLSLDDEVQGRVPKRKSGGRPATRGK